MVNLILKTFLLNLLTFHLFYMKGNSLNTMCSSSFSVLTSLKAYGELITK